MCIATVSLFLFILPLSTGNKSPQGHEIFKKKTNKQNKTKQKQKQKQKTMSTIINFDFSISYV